MIFFNKKNRSLSFYKTLNRACVYTTIFSVLIFSIIINQQEKEFSNSYPEKDLFISISLQNSLVFNFNERDSRQNNFANIKYSVQSTTCSFKYQTRLSDLHKIAGSNKLFGTILTSSPNNHSFRAPPNKA